MNSFKTVVASLILIGIISMLSLFSSKIWESDKVLLPAAEELQIAQDMSVSDFITTNKLPDKPIKKMLGISNKKDMQKPLSSFSLSEAQIQKKYSKVIALFEENNKKDWKKIASKFILWLAFIVFAITQLKKKKITAKSRVLYYAIGIVLFGIIFGSDPSPMGTIKDAIVLYGRAHTIFAPRMVALIVFLLFVVIANKSICAWGCQLGVLQDFLHRLGKDTKERSVIKQYKIPFFISNTIRIVFFFLIVGFALLWGLDLVGFIDPFKIFNPAVLGVAGLIFVTALLISAIYVYRPWCHLFCPFGLVGWFFEKLSILKIKVNYNKCIACGKCEKACPANAMTGILRREVKMIPDCFACGSCINVCPTDAISFSAGKRNLPPQGKFDKLNKKKRNKRKKK